MSSSLVIREKRKEMRELLKKAWNIACEYTGNDIEATFEELYEELTELELRERENRE